MKRISAKIIALLIGLSVSLLSGCAQVARTVDVLYAPQALYGGGSGTLELVTGDSGPSGGNGPAVRWVLGNITDSTGAATGEIITSMRPNDVIADAFKRELTAAGYQVTSAKSLDKNTKKGIIFNDISVKLEETSSLVKLESSCTILLKMDIWMNGTVVKRSTYQAKLSDTAVTDRDQLSAGIYQKAMRDLTQQALPDIIRQLN